MTITVDDLKNLFGPITKIEVQADDEDKVELDVGKVANALVNATQDALTGDDPDEQVDNLAKRVDEIDALLEKAEYDEESGKIFIPSTDEVSKEFTVEKEDEEGSDPDDDVTTDEDDLDDEDEDDDVVKDEDWEDDDDTEWPDDMAPRRPPTMRKERLTKHEVPVPARAGGGKVRQIHKAARDEAMGRKRKKGKRKKRTML